MRGNTCRSSRRMCASSCSPRFRSATSRILPCLSSSLSYGPGDRAVEVVLLLGEPVAVGHLDHASALAHLGHPRPQEPHDPLPGEAFPHPLEQAVPPFDSRRPDLPSRRRKNQNYASSMRHPSESGIPWASTLASVG